MPIYHGESVNKADPDYKRNLADAHTLGEIVMELAHDRSVWCV
jgi:hypothetical protein